MQHPVLPQNFHLLSGTCHTPFRRERNSRVVPANGINTAVIQCTVRSHRCMKMSTKKPDAFVHRDQGPTKSPTFQCKETPGKTCRYSSTGTFLLQESVQTKFNLVGLGLVRRNILRQSKKNCPAKFSTTRFTAKRFPSAVKSEYKIVVFTAFFNSRISKKTAKKIPESFSPVKMLFQAGAVTTPCGAADALHGDGLH